jgi:hypothetical protein
VVTEIANLEAEDAGLNPGRYSKIERVEPIAKRASSIFFNVFPDRRRHF